MLKNIFAPVRRAQQIVMLFDDVRDVMLEIDIAVPVDKRIGEKENEKVGNLKREIARMWNMRTVQVVPIVVGSLGRVEYQN